MLFKIKIGPQLNHPIPERRVSLVARCGRGQAGGISLPRRSGKPGRNLGCHRDMLAVEAWVQAFSAAGIIEASATRSP
jgi:hypothetical protein